jgi:hypothetical protein
MDIAPKFRNMSKGLNKHSAVIYEYLRKLERLGILKTEKHGQQKVWFLSDEFPYPKRRRFYGKGSYANRQVADEEA